MAASTFDVTIMKPIYTRIIPFPSKQISIYFIFYLKTFLSFKQSLYLCIIITMDKTFMTIEDQIAQVLAEISQKGFSSVQPFSIGKVETRMMQFAQVNAITLASDDLYMSAKQLQHCMRPSKAMKGLVVDDADLIGFPQNRFQMDLYYDGECFIYTDGTSKFIVHPNYQMKVSREVVKLVNFITATKRTDKKEFNGKRYVKIEADNNTE